MSNPVVSQVLDGMNSVVERYDAEIASLRTQLAEATARAERAERERDDLRRLLDLAHNGRAQLEGWRDGLERERDEARAAQAGAHTEIGSLMDRCYDLAKERDEARERAMFWMVWYEALSRQLASRIEMLTVANTTTIELRKRAEQAEQLCTERGEQVSRLFCQLRDMQVRAEKADADLVESRTTNRELHRRAQYAEGWGPQREERLMRTIHDLVQRLSQAEKRALSDETVRTVRELLREAGWDEQRWSLPIDRALAELDAKYPDKERP